MNKASQQRIVTLSMLWLGFLIIGSRPWTAKVGGKQTTTDALGQSKAFIQSKTGGKKS